MGVGKWRKTIIMTWLLLLFLLQHSLELYEQYVFENWIKTHVLFTFNFNFLGDNLHDAWQDFGVKDLVWEKHRSTSFAEGKVLLPVS